MLWSQEREDEVARLWTAGLTCSQVGAAMGISRCAVIGKVHRLKLPPRAPRINDAERELRKLKKVREDIDRQRIRRWKKREASMQPIERDPIPEFIGSLNIPFADLEPLRVAESNQCRFIPSENPAPDYRACASETLPGESWCEHCKGIVYNRQRLTEEERAQRVRHGTRNFHAALVKAFTAPRDEAAA